MRQILCTHYSAPSSDVFQSLQKDLLSRLPLHNLECKNGSQIDSLSLNFEPVSFSERPEQLDILLRPFLHLCFVNCEDNDVYRSTLRQTIRNWLEKVQRPGQEWLIVHVTSTSKASAKFYQRKSSVADKIKADFNSATPGKRDRVVVLLEGDGESWTDFMQKIKIGIVLAFQTNISAYEEDLRKLDSQRSLPGWNFCTFFIQKEGLAFTFEAMTLYADALAQYDQLELSFNQALESPNLVWFGTIGSPDSPRLSIFDYNQKPYRDLIKTNQISIFDFKLYQFSRQAFLLTKLGRVLELAKRGRQFILTLSVLLRIQSNGDGYQEFVYRACLELINQAKKMADSMQSQIGFEYHAVIYEIYDLARVQLEQLGVLATYLPPNIPFSLSAHDQSSLRKKRPTVTDSDSEDETVQSKRRSIVIASKPVSIFSDKDGFRKVYSQTCEACLDACKSARRWRSATRLAFHIAAFTELFAGTDEAQSKYAVLPPQYFDTSWKLIETALLAQCVRLQKSLGMTKDYLLGLLALLRCAWVDRPLTASLKQLAVPSLPDLVGNLRQSSSLLDKDFAIISFPAFRLSSLNKLLETSRDSDGLIARFKIHSKIETAVPVDEIRLKFCTPVGDFLWFHSKDLALSPRFSEVTAFCPSPFAGRLLLEVVQIRIARIVFQYHFRPSSERGSPWDRKKLSTSTFFTKAFRDPSAVTCKIESPAHTSLEGKRTCVLKVWTGRQAIAKMEAVIVDNTKRTVFEYSTLQDTKTPVSLTLQDLPASVWHSATIAYTCAGQQRDIPVEVSLKWTTSGDTVARISKTQAIVPFALPFSIGVQDYFRSEYIISQIRVTPAHNTSIVVNGAHLDGQDSFTTKNARSASDYPLHIQAGRSLSSLFHLRHSSTRTLLDDPKLKFCLTFCLLEDHYSASLVDMIRQTLDRRKAELPDPFIEALARRWSNLIIERIEQNEILQPRHISESLAHLKIEAIQEVFGPLNNAADITKYLEETSEAYQLMNVFPWQTLELNSECPAVDILTTARFNLPFEHRVSIGEPIQATLHLSSSFKWSNMIKDALQENGHSMSYQVQADQNEWALSGQVIGEYRAAESDALEIDLIFVPLKSGSLSLPNVIIRPLPTDQLTYLPSSELWYENAERRVFVLPKHTQSTYWVPVV